MCAVHDPEKVASLLTAGANPAAETRTGHTAVLIAAGYSGARASVDHLLARGVPIDRPVSAGNLPGATPLVRALMLGDADLAAALVTRGASVNGTGPRTLSPLMIMTFHGDADMVRWLLARGAAVDATVSDDFFDEGTALMAAVEDGRADIVSEAVKGGADVNKVDAMGHAALSVAAVAIDRGTTDVVDLLMKAGARPAAAAPPGEKSAAALARRWGKPHVAARIERQ